MATFVRLVVVPAAAAVLAWVVLFVLSGDDVTRHVVAGLLPLLGCALMPTARGRWRRGLAAAALGLHALVCVAFALLMVTLADDMAREPHGQFIPVLPYGLAFLLPFLAVGCGTVAMVTTTNLDRPRRR